MMGGRPPVVPYPFQSLDVTHGGRPPPVVGPPWRARRLPRAGRPTLPATPPLSPAALGPRSGWSVDHVSFHLGAIRPWNVVKALTSPWLPQFTLQQALQLKSPVYRFALFGKDSRPSHQTDITI